MNQQNALLVALNALQTIDDEHPYPIAKHAIVQISKALAQPEQGCAECGVKASDGYALYCVKCTDLFTQPEQEPVAWNGWVLREVFFDNGDPCGHREPPIKPWIGLTDDEKGCAECGVKASDGYALYCVKCSEPLREWIGLTDEDMGFLFPHGSSVWVQETVKIIEAALRSKNT